MVDNSNNVMVRKIDGTLEPFSEKKIRASATRVGVPADLQDELIVFIKSKLHPEMPTTEIFAIIKDFLSHSSKPYLSAKYNLKKALMDLGPSGYPFEKFFSRLLKSQGYQTKVNQVLKGKCVSHEVDVLAEKEGVSYVIEAKYHHNQRFRTDVKVPLYIKARYDDIVSGWTGQNEVSPWLVTNTKFSSDALAYGTCVGLAMTSWDYPVGESLREIIENTGLHPLTLLDTIPKHQLQQLLEEGFVLCKDAIEKRDALQKLLPKDKVDEIYDQALNICKVK